MVLDYSCLVIAFDTWSTRAQLSIVFTLSKPAGHLCYRASDFNKRTFVATCLAINTSLALLYSLKIVFPDSFLYCL